MLNAERWVPSEFTFNIQHSTFNIQHSTFLVSLGGSIVTDIVIVNGARTPMEDSLMAALLDAYTGLYMAQTSDNLARQYAISREEQGACALQSRQRAGGAAQACRLSEEIVPVAVGRKGEQIAKDDHLRPDT